eukprot:Rhum_TRINITY_DN21007_c0_g1::Rhum_TRINITY_DN21007_c0_g1_i1::g.172966::m.172966
MGCSDSKPAPSSAQKPTQRKAAPAKPRTGSDLNRNDPAAVAPPASDSAAGGSNSNAPAPKEGAVSNAALSECLPTVVTAGTPVTKVSQQGLKFDLARSPTTCLEDPPETTAATPDTFPSKMELSIDNSAASGSPATRPKTKGLAHEAASRTRLAPGTRDDRRLSLDANPGNWAQGGRKASRLNDIMLEKMMTKSPRAKYHTKKFGERTPQFSPLIPTSPTFPKAGACTSDTGEISMMDLPPLISGLPTISGTATPPPAAKLVKKYSSTLKGALARRQSSLKRRGSKESMSRRDEVSLEGIRVEDSDSDSEIYVYNFKEKRRNRNFDLRYANNGGLLSPPLTEEEQDVGASFKDAWVEAAGLQALGNCYEAKMRWEPIVESVRQSRKENPKVPEKLVWHAVNNWCCALHDNGDYNTAERHLRKALRQKPTGASDEDEVLSIVLNYNMALVLQDKGSGPMADPDNLASVEEHMRIATEMLAKRNGVDEVMTLTALSELSLAVFENARIVESYLLACRVKEGYAALDFKPGDGEYDLASIRLTEVFEVQEWYDEDNKSATEEELLIVKQANTTLGCRWVENRLDGITAQSPHCLSSCIGKVLRSVNGVEVATKGQLDAFTREATFLVLWFEEEGAGDGVGERKMSRVETVGTSAPTSPDVTNLSFATKQHMLQNMPSLNDLPKCRSEYLEAGSADATSESSAEWD